MYDHHVESECGQSFADSSNTDITSGGPPPCLSPSEVHYPWVLFLETTVLCEIIVPFIIKYRKAKMLVSKVVEDAGGATNMPVSVSAKLFCLYLL